MATVLLLGERLAGGLATALLVLTVMVAGGAGTLADEGGPGSDNCPTGVCETRTTESECTATGGCDVASILCKCKWDGVGPAGLCDCTPISPESP